MASKYSISKLNLNKFTFREKIKKVEKVPVNFKRCIESSVYIASKLLSELVETGEYPESLKHSKCDVLPDRSIFQLTVPFGKVIEDEFTLLVQVFAFVLLGSFCILLRAGLPQHAGR